MSKENVYDHEMLMKRFSDRDVELVLSRRAPESRELARLAPALEALHADRPSAPPEEAITRFAAEAAGLARSAAPVETAAPGADTPPVKRPRTFRRRVAVLATATLAFASMTGVAFAADSAAPGDPLYGIDRALERVGINDGGAGERLAEASVLTEQGRVADAMRHVAETMETPGEGATASAALREAADRLQASGDESSESVRAAVADMLSEMADMADDPGIEGAEFGARVSEMARQINENKPDDTPGADSTGPPENPGADQDQPAGETGPPQDKDVPGDQGKAGDQGPPTDQGKAGDQGPPADQRKAGDQGPPQDRGRPENPGKSSSGGKP